MKTRNILSTVAFMVSLFVLLNVMFVFSGCEGPTVGYLLTDDAAYMPDSLVVKATLDSVKDAKRIQFKQPWQSTAIEGVQGTMPINYRIKDIHSDNITAEIIRQFTTVQKGVIEIQWNHTLPVGIYYIDMEISNEGYTQIKSNIFKVIVK